MFEKSDEGATQTYHAQPTDNTSSRAIEQNHGINESLSNIESLEEEDCCFVVGDGIDV